MLRLQELASPQLTVSWVGLSFSAKAPAPGVTRCGILHLDQGNSWYQYRLGDEEVGSSPAEKDLGTLVDEKLDLNWERALIAQKASHALGCIPSSVASQAREGILPLCSDETPPGVLHPTLEPSAQDRHGPVGAGPEEGTKIIQWLEYLCCEEMKKFSTQEQAAQRCCRCPLPGSVQGQVGWGFVQCDLVKDVPACGRGFGMR